MRKLFYLIAITIFVLFNKNIFAQEHFVSFEDSLAIDQQLDTHFGINYEIDDLIFVDSLESNSDYNREGIDDEYGSLDNCVVFTAEIAGTIVNSKGIVGVYRNGQIIWYSDFIIPDDYIYGGGFITAIEDINNNGKVEIMTQWEAVGGANYSNLVLFVHTWDGNQGSLSIDISNGGSPIEYPDTKTFMIIDVQGDGIFEIISLGFGNSPTVYEWDGVNYSYSETAQIDSVEMFFPRNNFTPIVTCIVTKSNNNYIYNYTLKNSESSAQSINQFNVGGMDEYTKIYESNSIEDTNVSTVNQNWYGSLRSKGIVWSGYPIRPGNSLSGFLYKTIALPHIGYARLRGYNYQWAGDYGDNHSVYDYFRNSVFIKTIAAKLPPTPFVPLVFLDSLINYNTQSLELGWIKDEPTHNKYTTYLTNAKTAIEQNNNNYARANLESILTDVDIDSSSTLTSEAYALLKFNTVYLLNQIPEDQTNPNLTVRLESSQGNLLTTGSLQYYDAGWKDAVNNGDGTFNVITDRSTVSIRMTYAGGSQQLDNVDASNNTAIFTTVNTTVKLLDSQNGLLPVPSGDGGSVQYYASGWKEFGIATNGEVVKELLPKEYSFRMSYGGASLDQKQDIGTNATVIFQTINAKVQLKDSQGNLLNGGTVQYYASGWKDFGEAINGEAAKELLPKEYSFRMNYGGASQDQKQDIGIDPTVIFQTVNAKVQLKDSQGNLLSGGTVQYYASGWKEFGTAINGEAAKELLPKEYSFRMNYGGASIDQKQDIGVDGTVVFQTVNAKVQLKDSQGNLLSGGTVQYYASGWKEFGTAINGEAAKELLPKEYSFRMNYGGPSQDQKQDIGIDPIMVFQTVNAKVQLKDSQGNLLSGGTAAPEGGQVQYYASGWKEFGDAVNGEVTKELLPKEYSFRMKYGGASIDKKQDIGVDETVIFQTVSAKVQLKDSQGNLLSGGTAAPEGGQVQYYASGWKEFGIATNGEVVKELLPKEYSFRMSYGGASLDLKQDIINNLPVVFSTVNCVVRVLDGNGQPINNALASYYASGWKEIGVTENGEISKEVLPRNYSFRVNSNGVIQNKQQDITNNNIVEFVY